VKFLLYYVDKGLERVLSVQVMKGVMTGFNGWTISIIYFEFFLCPFQEELELLNFRGGRMNNLGNI
jgi:pilus assembly protein TadC